MVQTRASRSRNDENRIIAVVTGANSGLGFGICQVLLRSLSLPPGSPVYESTPVSSSIHSSLQHLLDDKNNEKLVESEDNLPDSITKSTPATLTLILVCRSLSNAEKARKLLLEEHEALLLKRAENGEQVRKGWWEGLEILCENCDFSLPGGDNGILDLCQRLKRRIPYITLLFLNAGLNASIGINWFGLCKEVITCGPVDALSKPHYQIEAVGLVTKDGERGLSWSVNTLAPYLLTTELIELLQQSPTSLDFSPKVIYTSSRTAEYSELPRNVLEDYQVKLNSETYAPTKYLANLVLCQLDRKYGSDSTHKDDNDGKKRKVRCVTVDPGCVRTSLMDDMFKSVSGGWAFYVDIIRAFYLGVFWILQNIVGSTWHVGTATNSAHAMVYAGLLSEKYIAPPEVSPAPTFIVVARRWWKPTVGLREVDHWREAEEIGRNQVDHCEALRLEWRKREGV